MDIVPVPTVLYTISRFYTEAVVRAGGVPVILPVLEPTLAAAALGRVDGLVIPGGGDVGPVAYGADAAPETRGVDPARDAWELACAAAALERGLPLLAICRGAQVLNVALGGTLDQHVPGHSCADRYQELVHRIRIAPGLASVMGVAGDEVGANSLHHQAVGRPGRGVRPVAWAPDGTVEAFEVDGHPDVRAVQWHPELLPEEEAHQRLFSELVSAAAVARPASTASPAPATRPGRVI